MLVYFTMTIKHPTAIFRTGGGPPPAEFAKCSKSLELCDFYCMSITVIPLIFGDPCKKQFGETTP